jgi:hypothetical protein
MALSDIADMTASGSLRGRIFAAATQAGKDAAWVNANISTILAADGWEAAWSAAKCAADATNFNPDTGIRTDVITDDMITAAVASLIAQVAQGSGAA